MSTQSIQQKRLLTAASMASNGSRMQFGVAAILITILPLLTSAYLFYEESSAKDLPGIAITAIWLILIAMVLIGYGLLVRYPITIINLRRHMESVARGEIPSAVALPEGEGDITAIQEYFNLIIDQMKKRITTIQEQQMEIVKSERQRVMIESICTACHHLGQPAATILCYLDLINRQALSEAVREYLALCTDEANRMRDIFVQLQSINEYSTESYCEMPKAEEDNSLRIIQSTNDRAAQRPDRRIDLQNAFPVESCIMVTS